MLFSRRHATHNCFPRVEEIVNEGTASGAIIGGGVSKAKHKQSWVKLGA